MGFTVTAPSRLVLPSSMGGNDTVFGMAQIATMQGARSERVGDSVVYHDMSDPSLFPIATLVDFEALGISTTGYGVTLQMTAVTRDTQIPVGVPGRNGEDENGDPIIRTFADLATEAQVQHAKDADGNPLDRWYIHDWGFRQATGLTSAEIAILYGVAGITVLNDVDFKAIADANTSSPI